MWCGAFMFIFTPTVAEFLFYLFHFFYFAYFIYFISIISLTLLICIITSYFKYFVQSVLSSFVIVNCILALFCQSTL